MLLSLLQTVVLTGGTVHSMAAEPKAQGPSATAAPVLASLVMEGKRITAVVPAGESLEPLGLPEDRVTIDVTGLHLVPGLVDGMANFDSDHDPLYIACGVTLVRDTGNVLQEIVYERDAKLRDRVPGPDLFVPGAILDGYPPATTEAAVMVNAQQAEEKLAQLLQFGLDFLSVHETLPGEAWRKAIEIGHANRLAVWGPLLRGHDLGQVIAAGQDGLFGLQALLPPGQSWHEVGTEDCAAAIAKLAASDVAITPMLSVWARMLRDRADEPPELARLGPHYRIAWLGELADWRRRMTPEMRGLTERSLARQRAVVARLYAAGVSIVPGSAAPNAWLVPGTALLDELDELVRSGLSSIEVLALATREATEELGLGAARGTLEPGRIADVVALGSDPRESLAGLRDPELVVVRGRVLEREDLGRLLDELESAEAKRLAAQSEPLEVAAPELPEGDVVVSGRAETLAMGQRISGESFAVVKTFDGRIAYCTRLFTPGSSSTADTELQLVQFIRDNRLESFSLRIEGAGPLIEFEGKYIAGMLGIEQKIAGVTQGNRRAQDAVSLIDVRSVTSDMILAQHFLEGPSFVVEFAGLDPVVDRWVFEVGDDGQLRATTGEGWMIAAFRENGLPFASVRRSGTAQTEIRILDAQTFGGPGLPLPEERVSPGPAVDAVEAGAAESPVLEPDDPDGGEDD